MKRTVIQPVIPGLLFSLSALLIGIGAGLALGGGVQDTKIFLQDGIEWKYKQPFRSTISIEEETLLSLHYFHRAYTVAQEWGALGMGMSLTLALLKISRYIKGSLSLAIGLGAFLYPCTLFLSSLALPLPSLAPLLEWLTSISAPLFFCGNIGVLILLLLVWLDPGLFSPNEDSLP